MFLESRGYSSQNIHSLMKSSPCENSKGVVPTKSNISTKLLVRQQLDAHYKKLQCARASVDTSAPYCIRSNPTTKSYRPTKYSPRPPSRPHSIRSLTTAAPTSNDKHDADYAVVPNDPAVAAILKHVLNDTDISFVVADASQVGRNSRSLPADALSSVSPRTKGSQVSYPRNNPNSSDPMTGDLLEKHRRKFTNDKPYSPRLIKSNAVSRLRTLRCYNPPKRLLRPNLDNSQHNDRPVISQTLSSKSRGSRFCNTVQVKLQQMALRCNRVADQSSVQANDRPHDTGDCQHHPHLLPDSKHPKHDSSLLTLTHTHLNPLGEKASLPVRIRSRSAQGLPPTPPPPPIPGQIGSELYLATGERAKSANSSISASAEATGIGSDTEGLVPNLTSLEECSRLNYLNFITAVTEDIIARASFTDEDVNAVMSEHRALNRFSLSVGQMRAALQHVRSHLNVVEEDTGNLVQELSREATIYDQLGESDVVEHGGGDQCQQSEKEEEEEGLRSSSAASLQPSSSSPSRDRNLPTVQITAPTSEESQPRLLPLQFQVKPQTTPQLSGFHHPLRVTTPMTAIARSAGTADNLTRSIPTHKRTDQVVGSPKINRHQETLTVVTDKHTVSSWFEGNTLPTDSQNPPTLSEQLAHKNQTDKEDTLNDQLTIANMSVSTFATDGYEAIQSGASVKSTESSKPEPRNALRNTHSPLAPVEVGGQPLPRPGRVTFAPNAEVFTAKCSELTTSVTSLTDLTTLSSPEGQCLSHQEQSSPHAVAEGDSNAETDSDEKKGSIHLYSDDDFPQEETEPNSNSY